MSGRPRQVDLGPLYLPVGEDVNWPIERTGLADDANQFAALLEAGRPRAADDRSEQAGAQADDGTSASDLAAHVQDLWEREAPGADGEVRSIKVPSRKDGEFLIPVDPTAQEIERSLQALAAADGQDDGQVRVIPGKDVSPHTTLRLYAASGALHVEIHCDASANPAWFIPRLPSLGRDLASRLQRAVCVALFGPSGARIGHFESSEPSAWALHWRAVRRGLSSFPTLHATP